MNRKITAVLLIVCMLTSILPVFTVSADVSPFYKVIAESTMDQTTYGSSSEVPWSGGKSPVGYGTGWSDTYWTGGSKSDGYGVFMSRPISSSPSTRITRGLAETIDFSKEGVYTFTLELRDGMLEPQIAVMELGDSGIKFGAAGKKDGNTLNFSPHIQLPGKTMEISTSAVSGMSAIKSMITVLTITAGDGDDTLEVKTYLEGTTTPVATISKTAELSGITMTSVKAGFDYNSSYEKTSGTSGVSRIRKVQIEYDNPNAMTVINAAKESTATVDDIKAAYAVLADYSGSDRDTLIAVIKANAVGKGDFKPEVISADPDFKAGEVTAASFGDTFTINYSYPLVSGGTVYVKDAEGNAVAQSSDISGKTVTMTKTGEFAPGATYTVTSADVVDFKGDLVKDCTFATTLVLEFYNVIAEDSFIKADYCTDEEINNATNNEPTVPAAFKEHGTGWNGIWSTTGSGGKFDGNGLFIGRPSTALNPRISRNLKKTIDFSKNGIYTFTFEVRDQSTDTQSAVMELGDSGIKFGAVLKTTDDKKFYPQLQIPGESAFTIGTSGAEGMTQNKSMIAELKITVADGEDTLEVVTYLEGTTKPAAVITKTVELAGKTASYISAGYDYCASYARANGVSRIYKIKAEYDNPNGMATIEAAKGSSATENDIKSAFSLLASYDGNVTSVIESIKANAIATGNEAAIYADIVSANPDFVTEGAVEAGSFENTFTVTYSYPLKGTGTLYVKQDESVIAQSTKIDGQTVTFRKTGTFQAGKIYDIVTTDVVDFKNDLVKGTQFSTYVVPVINVVNGDKYDIEKTITWEETDGMTVSAKLTSFAEQTSNVSIENNTRLTVAGTYRLTITASLPGLPEKTTIYNFDILPDVAPVAKDVTIALKTGEELQTGATLKGSFTFYDENACDEFLSATYNWYRTKDGGVTKTKIGEGQNYTLTEADENHDIILGVIPVSTSDANPTGEEAFSSRFKGAYAPTATTVTIDTSSVAVGSQLKAVIDYADANGDAAGIHLVKWYHMTEAGDEEITTNVSSDGVLTVTGALAGESIYAIVTPVSSKLPYNGTPVRSGAVALDIVDNSSSGVAEKSDFEMIDSELLFDDVNNYPFTEAPSLTDHRAYIPSGAYNDGSVGFATNWSTNKTKYVALTTNDSNCFQNAAAYGGWSLCYSGPAVLYRALETPLDMSVNGTYTFVTEVFDYTGSGLTGTDFRMYIGTEDWYYGYTAPNSIYIPHIQAKGGDVIKAEEGVAYSGSSTAFIKAEVVVTDGLDTFRVKMWTGATEPGEWAVETTGELGNQKAAWIGFTPNPGNSNSQRYISFKASFENVALKNSIQEVADKPSPTEEEVHNALAALSAYPDGEEKDNLTLVLLAKATVEAATAKLLETSVSTTEKEVASEIETITFKYDFMLDKTSTFTVKDSESGEVVSSTTSIKENKVTLNITGDFAPGASYTVDTSDAKDYKGNSVPGFAFTTYDMPSINVSDGGSYSEGYVLSWTANPETVVTISGKTEPILSPYSLETGEYTLTISDVDTRTITFKVVEDVAPIAKNVKVTGFHERGATLTGSYVYYDVNGDAEAATVTNWYRVKDGTETLVASGVSTYTLASADDNADIIFEVTPKSNSLYENEGEPARSAVFVGPYAPEALNLVIAGENKIDGEIYASYEFSDVNGDAEGATEIKWYLENGTPITENITDGKLKVTDALIAQTVYVTVKPVSAKYPKQGALVTSAKLLMPTKPSVSNVTITGTAAIGNMLIADYVFTDPNGDVQGESTFVWKNASTGEVLGTGRALEVTSAMAGINVTVTVTGVSEKAPYESTPVTSAAFGIPSSLGGGSGTTGNFTTSGSLSGSSGGSSGTGGSTITPVTPVTPVTPEKVIFGDIKGHWGETYVNALLEKGIVVEDENFRPNDSISRAEVLAMLFRSAGTELSKYDGTYGDVNSADWFAEYVQTALDNGIVSADANFRPNDSITREEAAKIVANMLKLELDKDAEFNDKALVSDWAVTFVNAVIDAGIFKGDDNGNFNPKGALTRAETATVIYRLIEAGSFNVGGAE